MATATQSFKHILQDSTATALLGQQLGQVAQKGDVILLHGDLGVGKTTLTQSIAQGLEGEHSQKVGMCFLTAGLLSQDILINS